MERIDKAGDNFRSLAEAIDTTTSAGRMMMQMVGSFSEFEREMIRERTLAGLKAARAQGRNSGADMARLYNISEAIVSRIVANARHQNETST